MRAPLIWRVAWRADRGHDRVPPGIFNGPPFALSISAQLAKDLACDLYKSHAGLKADDIKSIALGFGVAFVAGVVVVRYLLDFVGRHGFAPFAWWRIVVGGMGMGALAVLG